MRLDKWLWSVRLSKTRSDAAELCKGGRVLVNDTPAKASREVQSGDEISVRRMPVVFRYKALELPASRMAAKNLGPYIANITPAAELAKLEMASLGAFAIRDRGAGRPTKKERRDIEGMLDDFSFSPGDEDDE